MPVSDEYLIYAIDQLANLGPVTSRRMFGGAGLYCDGVMFAIVADDTLYFKVDDSNRADYEAADMNPFTFTYNGGEMKMSYWEVPIDILENKDNAVAWAHKALVIALAAKKTKPKKEKVRKQPQHKS